MNHVDLIITAMLAQIKLHGLGDGSFPLNNPIRTFRIFLRAEVD